MASGLATVILAAGSGTRMKSTLPKVLHPVGGRPMVVRAVETALSLDEQPPVVVIGHGADRVRAAIGDRARYVVQAQQLGTGHAVRQAADLLRGQADHIVVYYADMPLLTTDTLQTLLIAHLSHAGPIALLTLIAPDPRGFGRIARDSNGITAIVEERDATPDQLAIRELNVGVYVFRAAWLWDALDQLTPARSGEYYLTDLVGVAIREGRSVIGVPVTDADEVIGINTRVHLSEAEAALRRRVNRHWMLSGVTLQDPATTYIDERVMIGTDSLIAPNTHLIGQTTIGAACTIGPNTVIRDSTIGNACTVNASVVESATLEAHVEIGPFAHLRSGAYLESGVHMGNFGEVKNSRLGAGTKMGHFSYLGDATIGADVNIGAGVVTVNYDGERKHPTTIGDHAFIGSDSMLVAPVTIATNGRTGAGSVVTRDVPADHIAVGVPARMLPIKHAGANPPAEDTRDPQRLPSPEDGKSA